MYKILLPESGEKAYQVAAEAFQTMYEKVTGEKLPIICTADTESDLIVIGSDAVNDFTAQAFAEDWIDSFNIRYGTDDYAIRSVEKNGHTYLFLAGGRGRSTLYAVYDYFERVAGCHYYWDGDVIPHHHSLPLGGLCVTEQPRFEYRGLRYFAHRGLHRFQAEHWSLEDWKQEIDWMVKRRLNYFMLRIGMDDIWQRAFPDIVDYPSATEKLPEAGDGYDDRTLFWSLEYRSVLRKKLMEYAFERDLMHSEDCGTMTHWYSRTPVQYLEAKKPTLLAQATKYYHEQTGLCWDPRVKENLDNYLKLTDVYANYYGKPELFHTIGLAERVISEDHDENRKIKLFTYRRILQNIREKYPMSKMLIASWDFFIWWKPEEVQALLREFDPSRTIILDYISERRDPKRCFLNWDMMGKFPWIFGLFHGFERANNIRGMYDVTKERLGIAKEDPMCKGMIFWPELSHSDTLVLEYLARNSWKPEQLAIEPLVEDYSAKRYSEYGAQMNAAWQAFLPYSKLVGWEESVDELYQLNILVNGPIRNPKAEDMKRWGWAEKLQDAKNSGGDPKKVLSTLASLPKEALDNPFVRRDVVDIAHSLTERLVHWGILKLCLLRKDFMEGADNAEAIRAQIDAILAVDKLHTEIVACHEDYSMYATLEGLKKVAPVNPIFETALKHNQVNGYCRQACYEPEKYLMQAEHQAYFDWVLKNVQAGNRAEWVWDLDDKAKELYDAFMEKPLVEMQSPCDGDLLGVIAQAAEIIEDIKL